MAPVRLKVARLNRCFIPQAHEKIAGTLAVRAFFIAVISGCLTVCTLAPIKYFDSNCVNAAAALFAAGFATTAVCDPHVVTSAATLCTTRNRQFSLHLLMIPPCWCVHCSIRNAARNGPVTKFPLTDAVTGEVQSSTKPIGQMSANATNREFEQSCGIRTF